MQPRVTKASREEVVDKYLGAHGWPSEEGPSYVSLMYGPNRYPEMIPPEHLDTYHSHHVYHFHPTDFSMQLLYLPSAICTKDAIHKFMPRYKI